jgi:CheY-like chemotaxis protein
MTDRASGGGPDAVEGGRPRASVLYIEDSAPNVRLVEHILHAIDNLEIASAPTGEHGIRLARRLRPSMILLDLHLPDLRGEEVLERLRAQRPTRDIPVVVISGDLTDPQRRRLSRLGVAAFLAKPYSVSDLIAVVERLITPAAR